MIIDEYRYEIRYLPIFPSEILHAHRAVRFTVDKKEKESEEEK